MAMSSLHVELLSRDFVVKCLQTLLSVAELGREAIPCKDWPSATASGGCGLDKELPPDVVCHQKIDGEIRSQISRESPLKPSISYRWFSTNFRPSLTTTPEIGAWGFGPALSSGPRWFCLSRRVVSDCNACPVQTCQQYGFCRRGV